MIRRFVRTITIPLAVMLLLSAIMAPGVLAKGRPTRVEITQAACGSFTAQVSWWKKLDVHEVFVIAYFNGSEQRIQIQSSSDPFTSPRTVDVQLLPWISAGGLTTYRVDVSLYSDRFEQNLLDSGTASITFDCTV